jgi:hypothetical protein
MSRGNFLGGYNQPVTDLLSRQARPIIGVLAASVAVASFGLHVGETMADPSLSPAPLAEPSCPAPSTHALQAVEAILRKPADGQAILDRAARIQSAETGLRGLRQLPTDTVSHTRSYIAKANDMLSPYGIHFAPDPLPHTDKGSHLLPGHAGPKAPNDTGVETFDATARSTTQHAIRGIYRLPISYVRYSGVTEISYYHLPKDYVLAYVTADQSDKARIHLNIAEPADDQTLPHELGHMIDHNECGAASKQEHDPAFTNLNGPMGGRVYLNKKVPYSLDYIKNRLSRSSLENYDFYSRFNDLTFEQSEAVNHHDHPRYLALKHKKDVLLDSAVSVTDYGLTNDLEDKAVYSEAFVDPLDFASQLSPNTPRIRAKFLILLGRLYDSDPEAAKQLLGIASRTRDRTFDNRDHYATELRRIEREKANPPSNTVGYCYQDPAIGEVVCAPNGSVTHHGPKHNS